MQPGDQDRGPAWKPAKADVASSLNIVISFFHFIFSKKIFLLLMELFLYYTFRSKKQKQELGKRLLQSCPAAMFID